MWFDPHSFQDFVTASHSAALLVWLKFDTIAALRSSIWTVDCALRMNILGWDLLQQVPVINCRFCLLKIVRIKGLCDYPTIKFTNGLQRRGKKFGQPQNQNMSIPLWSQMRWLIHLQLISWVFRRSQTTQRATKLTNKSCKWRKLI